MSATGPKSNPDRRTTPRAHVEITSMIRANDQKMCAIVFDLTAQGMAVRAAETLVSNSLVDVWFSLPYSDRTIQCEGEVIWTDGMGRAGVRFLGLTDEARRGLTEWLTQYAPA